MVAVAINLIRHCKSNFNRRCLEIYSVRDVSTIDRCLEICSVKVTSTLGVCRHTYSVKEVSTIDKCLEIFSAKVSLTKISLWRSTVQTIFYVGPDRLKTSQNCPHQISKKYISKLVQRCTFCSYNVNVLA